MSTTAQKPEPIGIDDDFELLDEQIAALKELARLDDVPDGRAYDFGIRWGQCSPEGSGGWCTTAAWACSTSPTSDGSNPCVTSCVLCRN